ncbi:Hypothetical protein RG1141_CH24030 [Neorhizobium galegae bv. officinalis bv. officinalis str. HAMBI 1141]|uniref:Exonuclease SbcC n=1 Tax=Neorhizobium galegae bv. officinalis bv. officinalis str. HAMBI 1141 TaxID=1028801 RepID=A0A068T9N7_NEOGA|nr:hypothetical protein [Neorhizobium galegae]CDN54741.1 Hypothetical protein RG1141_CH24030 [Neorhizobium galegae bv. officinalis bv. officinalis str. HAMBI 1141]
MIVAWFQKAATPFIVAALMLLAASLLGWLALRTVDGLVEEARSTAIAERNAFWEGKIDKANAAANKQIADQASAALKIQSDATDQVRSAEQLLAELKVKNAQLPRRDDCGLSVERGRLLPD